MTESTCQQQATLYYRMYWLVDVLDGQQPVVQITLGRQLEEGLGLALLQQVHWPPPVQQLDKAKRRTYLSAGETHSVGKD